MQYWSLAQLRVLIINNLDKTGWCYLETNQPLLQNTLWELIGPKLTHLLSFASLLCSCCRCHWWKGWLCHLNLGSQVFCCCWMKIGLAQAFCLRGSRRCQRGVQILHSTFTQHLIWSQPQSTPTKGHSFSDLCISGHFWRRQRRVCYGVSKIDILCADTLFTSNRIQEGFCPHSCCRTGLNLKPDNSHWSLKLRILLFGFRWSQHTQVFTTIVLLNAKSEKHLNIVMEFDLWSYVPVLASYIQMALVQRGSDLIHVVLHFDHPTPHQHGATPH